jgi:peptide-methionine (S)-S-oxide reductase
MFAKPVELPSAEQALPGRAEEIQIDPVHTVLGTSMLAPFPEDCERVVFGLGCFWGAERKFWTLGGVYTTAVGYAAGYTPNPTYQEVCTGMTGHNEVVLVVYRPAQIDFDALLKTFWESHDPTQGMRQGNDRGTQYRSGFTIIPSSSARRRSAVYRHISKSLPRPVLRRLPPKSCRRDRSITPKATTSSISTRIQRAIADSAVPV